MKLGKILGISAAVLGTTFVAMNIVAKKSKSTSVYDNNPEEKNPLEGKKVVFIENENEPENADGIRGHLEAVGEAEYVPTVYDKYFKRGIDIILSFGGLVALSPVFAVTALAIKIEDPGPVFFTQKRVGQSKEYFMLHKFRSMKMCTPHDVPTHMLDNPDQYITKIGRFIRKYSLDELPQIWDIFVGNMSVIGPRPGLWNQDLLTSERDKYGANDVKPGLTGLAQISGRDELEIPEKAKLDGLYADALKKSSIGGFIMDCKMFFGSIFSVLKHEGIVEGGTGALAKGDTKLKQLDQDNNEVYDDLNFENAPLVSVVIATYRREESLQKAIISIINQTYSNVEVIIVDDNSNEEWNNKVDKIIEKCRVSTEIPIIYIKNEHNLGSARTRNIGIDNASGEYITFLDDDDIYLPNKIEYQVRDMIKQNADYGLTDLALYNDNGELIDYRSRKYITAYDQDHLMKYHLLYHMTGTDTLMFKADYLRKIGCFPTIDVGDEFYLMQKAILGNGSLVYSANCFVKAIVHEGNEVGISSGQNKIDGENKLFKAKQLYFHTLSSFEKKYIKVRHHAVLAFAYKRMNNLPLFFKEGMLAFFVSPTACFSVIRKR